MRERAVWKTRRGTRKSPPARSPVIVTLDTLLSTLYYFTMARMVMYLQQQASLTCELLVLSNHTEVACPSCMPKPECTMNWARSCEKRVDADEGRARRPPAATVELLYSVLYPSESSPLQPQNIHNYSVPKVLLWYRTILPSSCSTCSHVDWRPREQDP